MAVSLRTYNVNRSSFSVPSDLKVLSAEGFGAQGDSVRCTKMITYTQPGTGSNNNQASRPQSPRTPNANKSVEVANSKKAAQQQQLNMSAASGSAAAAPSVAPVIVEEERSFIIRKFSGVVTATHPRDLKRVVRLCQLHLALGNAVPGLLPLVDAYRDDQAPGDVYCIYPALQSTLAEVVYSRTPLGLDQGAAIIRELAKSLEKLHSLGLVLGDLRPDWIRIDPQLKTVGSVSIANVSYVHFPSIESVESVFGGLEASPGHKPLLWYRAPELVLQGVSNLTPAADMWTLGCILAELFLRRPLFECSNTREYLDEVTNALGIPTDAQKYYSDEALSLLATLPEKHAVAMANSLPGVPLEIVVLVQKLLCWNPQNRMTAKDLLRMPLLTPLPPPQTTTVAPNERGGGGGAGGQPRATAQQQQQQQAAEKQAAAQSTNEAAKANSAKQQQQMEAMEQLKSTWKEANSATVRDVASVLVKQLDECVSFY